MSLSAQASAITPLAGVPPRARHAVFALIATLSISNLIGTALSPYLVVEHPLWLVAMSPEGRHVVLAATSAPTGLLIALGTLRRLLALVTGFGLGILYGEAAVRWAEQRVPRLSRIIRFFERLFARFGLYLLLVIPLPSIAVLAGAARARFTSVAIAGALGQVTWMTLTVYFGEAVSGWTQPIIAFLSRHLIESTVVCAALVGLQQLVAYQKRKSARPVEVPESLTSPRSPS